MRSGLQQHHSYHVGSLVAVGACQAIDDYVLSLVSTSVPGELDWRNIQTVLRQSISSVFTLIHSSLLVPTHN